MKDRLLFGRSPLFRLSIKREFTVDRAIVEKYSFKSQLILKVTGVRYGHTHSLHRKNCGAYTVESIGRLIVLRQKCECQSYTESQTCHSTTAIDHTPQTHFH